MGKWKAPQAIMDRMKILKEKDHSPRLDMAAIAIAVSDSKPFVKNRFNWGSVSKFSDFNKIWQSTKFDFSITICLDVWEEFLDEHQQDALLDLHLTRCEPVYEAEVIEENGKKIIVKDDYGRTKFTEEIKVDENGNPKWQVVPVDLIVVTQNVQRYGLWSKDLIDLEVVISDKVKFVANDLEMNQ